MKSWHHNLNPGSLQISKKELKVAAKDGFISIEGVAIARETKNGSFIIFKRIFLCRGCPSIVKPCYY